MRIIWIVLLIAVVAGAGWGIWWYGWGRFTAGPPETVVENFLKAVLAKDWGSAEGYMTIHTRNRIGREGQGGMQRFVEARLEPFTAFEIDRATRSNDRADVVARLLLPVPEGQAVPPFAPPVGLHGTPGRIVGTSFVHTHRFVLQIQGRNAWRIYQFEEVDDSP